MRGAVQFGFSSETFTFDSTADGDWLVESQASSRVCTALLDKDKSPPELGFTCRDERTEELQCVITLTLKSPVYRPRKSGTNEEDSVATKRVEDSVSGTDKVPEWGRDDEEVRVDMVPGSLDTGTGFPANEGNVDDSGRTEGHADTTTELDDATL